MLKNRTLNILGFDIFDCGFDEIISVIDDSIKENKNISCHNVNANVAYICSKNNELKNNLRKFTNLFSDGVGIYFASKILYGRKGLSNRITGTDLYYKILEYAGQNKLRIFFLGGDPKAKLLLEESIRTRYPDIIISGIISRQLHPDESTISQIKNSGANILFIGLGTPYQEEFIAKNSNELNIPVQFTVGSGIDFLAGYFKRAPKIMRNLGLEWLYRFFKEPFRLFKRYFFDVYVFFFKILMQKFNVLKL
jgi:N-acetylglucosaminyldiphosphoundecaprenol N-acetyl-beta-D-mannosaminyltransferase